MTNAGRSNESEIAVYLGLGSNVGDREANLREAIERIKALGLEIKSQSSIYETEPVGVTDQPWFLNQAVETTIRVGLTSDDVSVLSDLETPAAAQAAALLSKLLEIERQMGRERTIVNGPRVIDIDLLLFGDLIISSKEDLAHSEVVKKALSKNQDRIVVPHPRMHLRSFVLEPLCEIAPQVVHPVLKKTCREILVSLDDASPVRVWQRMSNGPRQGHRS